MNKIRLLISFLAVFAAGAIAASGQEKPAANETETPRKVVIQVNGMFCPFCTFGVEKRLRKLDETAAVRTNLAAGEAVVTLKSGAEFVEQHFADAIDRAGFSHSGIALRTGAEVEAMSEPAGFDAPEGAAAPAVAKVVHAEDDIRARHVRTIGEAGDQPGQFRQPMTVEFAAEGWFVAADAGNARIQQFHADGAPWRSWTVGGDGETPLTNPVGLAVAPEGDVWVGDYDDDLIHHYDATGKPLGMFGESGDGPGQFDAPSGVDFMPDGNLAVVDFYNHRVQLLTPEGEFIRSIGKQGLFRRLSSAGLNYPTRLTVAPDGTLWVGDAYNYRVAAFSPEGELLVEFGEKGSGPGEFNVSSGIALLPGDRLAVADFMNHRIQIWTRAGELVGDFGRQGSEPGQFERPTDATLAPDGRLYVVDWGNHRLQVFDVEIPE